MVRRFLCTTALEETWRGDGPVLFLGEWCRLYSRREAWSTLQAEVMPYHWDDRAKLHADFEYLQGLHERLLCELTVQLNEIHGVDHDLRYWRILIGPWLGYFVQMLFDRWSSIQQANAAYDLSGTVVLDLDPQAVVPRNMSDFIPHFTGDLWNHHIYALLLRHYTKVPCSSQQSRAGGAQTNPAPRKQSLKQKIADWCAQVASVMARDEDAFLFGTYLPLLDESILYCRLGQVPQFWRHLPAVRVDVDGGWRAWKVAGENRSEFESCARALIPQQIPTAYLEGYTHLVEQAERTRWPKRPKAIWTSIANTLDDVFKVWAAQKVQAGAALVIGQHGGHFGSGRWSFAENHDHAICDRYLSWGWTEPRQPKVRAVGQLKAKRPLNVRHAAQDVALLVTCTLPRFSYWMYSAVVARQWLDYFDDQCSFVEHLPRRIRSVLTVRLYPGDFGWEQAARWRDRFADLRLDSGNASIDAQMRRSRLYIATYNATTYLESFNMNMPTVIFWNPRHWELRDSAIEYFEDLGRVGIFHESPESAARHVAAVWDDVDAWWFSERVQEVLARFKRRYCDLPVDLLPRIENVLQELTHAQARVGS